MYVGYVFESPLVGTKLNDFYDFWHPLIVKDSANLRNCCSFLCLKLFEKSAYV